jgi:hypothetical protein
VHGRRQRGVPLPLADKVFPFRADSVGVDEPAGPLAESAPYRRVVGSPVQVDVVVAEAYVADAWARLEAAERAGRSPRLQRALEAAYLEAMSALRAGATPLAALHQSSQGNL